MPALAAEGSEAISDRTELENIPHLEFVPKLRESSTTESDHCPATDKVVDGNSDDGYRMKFVGHRNEMTVKQVLYVLYLKRRMIPKDLISTG